MAQLLRILFQLSWGLGLMSLLAAVVVKLMQLEAKVLVNGHTLILLAGTLFLCSLTTREMGRSG